MEKSTTGEETMINDFDYSLRAEGRTVGSVKTAFVQEVIDMELADGTRVQIERRLEIKVTKPHGR